MRMFDDTLMNAVFDRHIAETEVLIQIILGRYDIRVISTKTQEEFINVYGRMVTLDIIARDTDNKLYNIEVQRDKYKASPQRARYLKESEGGNAEMCELVEEYAEKKAMREKMKNAKKLIALNKLTLQEIAESLDLSLATVEELAKGRTA